MTLPNTKTCLSHHLKPGNRILEVGCGFGSLTQDLSNIFKEVTSLDILDACVEKTKTLMRKTMSETDNMLALYAKYQDVENLLLKDDPPEQPYNSRYKARELLEEMLRMSQDLTASMIKKLSIHILAKLGAIDQEVEELAKSQEHLEAVQDFIDSPDALSSETIIPRLVVLNQLGILWTSRGEMEKAKSYLLEANALYERFKTNGEGPLSLLEDLIRGKSLGERNNDENQPDREKALELLNTHTYYYLAQVYEKLGARDKAGECCHITLKKQLKLKEFNSLDWAQNAATLSHFYEVDDNFPAAKTHLGAASYVLTRFLSEMESKEFKDDEERNDLMEKIGQTQGMVLRCWGKYALVLLQKSFERMCRQSENSEDPLVVKNIEDEEFPSMLEEFPSIEIDPEFQDVPSQFVKTFEQARQVFLPGQRFLNRAKEIFTFEEHCTDFTEINQELSALHKALVVFEPNPDRRFKIHKRRVELLEMPLKELGNASYLLVRRQLMFELGETHESMMDAKLDQIRNSPGHSALSSQMEKVNTNVSKAVSFFKAYLDSLQNKEGHMPDPFPAEICRPALVAYFHLARLFDKFMVAERTTEAFKNKLQVYYYFKKIVDYCQSHPEAEGVVAEELPLCQEMVRLLPVKIEKMKAELQTSR
ncbi:hypothetical protein TCAL_00816 [Tigriopus californicus]|uniref:KIF-binding protein n=1 Tax=Tigriopus californicus TaxID=6832 RepID=A0A553NDX4_TIGCA|nr:hypothetical protein TCAL_00816 [Tigriopus californicus]